MQAVQATTAMMNAPDARMIEIIERIGEDSGCANCGKPFKDHCTVHLAPCCPGKCEGYRLT